jgi:hypothetical protein
MDTKNKEINNIEIIMTFIEKAFEMKGLPFSKDEKKSYFFLSLRNLGFLNL